jgi:CRP-like cAMP-binding protein
MKRTNLAESGTADLIDGLAGKLGQHGPLARVGAATATSLIRLGALVDLESGETLIREDEDAAPEIYLLLEGALVVRSKTGTMARLSRPGDVVGEVAVLLSSKRTADVVADSAVRVLAIPSQVLKMPEYAEAAADVNAAMLRDDWVQY